MVQWGTVTSCVAIHLKHFEMDNKNNDAYDEKCWCGNITILKGLRHDKIRVTQNRGSGPDVRVLHAGRHVCISICHWKHNDSSGLLVSTISICIMNFDLQTFFGWHEVLKNDTGRDATNKLPILQFLNMSWTPPRPPFRTMLKKTAIMANWGICYKNDLMN